MKSTSYLGTFKGALQANKISGYVLLVSLVTNLILALALSSKETTVVMQPPLLSEEGWLAKDDASMSMKESWGMYIATLLGNTTPRSVSGLGPAMGKVVSPGAYQSVMDSIAALKKEVESEQLEIQFAPTGVFYVPARDIVAVSGELRMRSARGIEKRFVRTYEIGLKFKDYKPSMTSLDIYEGPFKVNGNKKESK